MGRVEAAVKALLVARLRERRAAGTLSTAVVRAAATDIGVAERTVWGWVAAGPQALDQRGVAETRAEGEDQVLLLAGTYRIPERGRFLLRAALHSHDHDGPLLATSGTNYLSPQRLAHTVRRGATLTGLDPPPAGRPLYGINPATPFAPDFTNRTTITDS